jgi:hypothetical protein
MRIIILFLFLSLSSFAQFQKTDSVGNFYVINNKLIWQKYYHLDDIDELDQQLKSNDLTNNLNILRFGTSAMSNLLNIAGNNLPMYTKKGFKAFVVIDIKNDSYRVSIKDITFPDFVEERYYSYYGPKTTSGGSLDYYILRQDETIKRNNATLNVLNSFDTSFSEVFDYIGTPFQE